METRIPTAECPVDLERQHAGAGGSIVELPGWCIMVIESTEIVGGENSDRIRAMRTPHLRAKEPAVPIRPPLRQSRRLRCEPPMDRHTSLD